MIYVPIRRTRLNQPNGDGIDWTNPLTKDLVVAYNAGSHSDLYTGKPANNTGTVNKVLGENGVGIAIGTTTSYASFASSVANVTGDITILAFCKISNTSSDSTVISKNNSSGGPSDPSPFDFGSTTGGTASIGKIRIARSNSGGYRVWGSAVTFSSDTDVVIAARQGNNISVTPTFFLNGVKDLGAATNMYSGSGSGATGSNTHTVKIANRGDLSTFWNGGAIYLVLVWKRQLTDREISIASSNIGQIFL